MDKETLLIAAIVFGLFVSAWGWAISIENPMPILVWFGVALAVLVAGGEG